MKIYAANDSKYTEFEQFAGKDMWIAVISHNATFGIDVTFYVNVIDMDIKATTYRYVFNKYISGEYPMYSEYNNEPEMITQSTKDFLDRFEIIQPMTLITTDDMEELLGMKLTHIEDWY